MPRAARKRSQTGIYHVMLRGINKQNIFEDEEDYSKFVQVLEHCKDISEYKIYAYCLMGNHLHLLIHVQKEGLEQIFKRIGASYVYWFNWKYKRSGHLFQDRYKSEPVEDDSYFLTVLRYIHQNPVKAKMCKKVDEYKWCGYNDYIYQNGITDTAFVLGIFNDDYKKAKELFINYNNEQNDDICLEINEKFRMTDDEARKIIYKISKAKSVSEFQIIEIKKRNVIIKKLKEQGISIRQIARLTGVSFGIIRKT